MVIDLIPLGLFDVVSLPLARGEGNNTWVVVGCVLAGWWIVRGGVRTAEKSRNHIAATDRKRCVHCRTGHPGFAGFCRQCGAKF